jgi:predicted transcriptional regulator
MSIQKAVTKEKLVTQTKNEFLKAGYHLCNNNIKSNAFDFIARKEDSTNLRAYSQKLITKVLVDLDLFKKQTSIDLRLISNLISGFPLLVANSAAGKNIEDSTLYRRHNVSAISLKTLQMFLQYERGSTTKKISKFAQRGGIFVNLSKEKFKEQRERLQLDMTIFAKKIGISRHSLYKYEKGERFPKIKHFNILCNILGDDLDVPLNILENRLHDIRQHTLEDYRRPRSPLQKEITSYLAEKEFNILWFKSEPFDGLSEPNIDNSSSKNQVDVFYPMITGVTSSNDRKDSDKLMLIDRLAKFLDKKAVWFMDDDDNIENLESPKDSSHFSVIKISDLEGMALIDFKKILEKKKFPKTLTNKKNG